VPATTNAAPASEHSSSEPKESDGEKPTVELVHTISKVPGNTHYYEKDGLRTYGDDMDHDHEPPVSSPLFMICSSTDTEIDDHAPFDVLDRNGFPLYWIPDSGLLVW